MKTKFYIVSAMLLAVCTGLSAVAELTVTATPQKYAALPTDVFPVEYIVSWTDSDGNFVVLPPELPVLEWGTATVLKMQRSGNETRFIVGCRADNPGTYTIPGLTIRLATDLDPAVTDITQLDDTAPTRVVETEPVQVTFQKPRTGLWVGGALAVVLICGGLVFRRIRKGNRSTSDDAGLSPLEQAQELLHEARRSRLDGDFYAFYRALHGALTCIATQSPAADIALCEKIKRAIDDTGYRGVRPPDDVLEGDFKDVERIVAQEQQRVAKET